ncbi:uncharacterized protein LOC143547665 [Bidens hawaiensis]|uniref:uncharacterized protein LOC143547665 n=1 Tax=Bidens hawaiensis TaxID=980011 RepID=UPI0040495C6D
MVVVGYDMSGRAGGYCIARYDGGGGGCGMYGQYGMSKVETIMLKFRPIAPKPVAAGSGGSATGSEEYVKCGRSKRKYVRVNNNKQKKNNNIKKVKASSSPDVTTQQSQPVVTLPLLPETPDRKENKPVTCFPSDLVSHVETTVSTLKTPVWLSFNKLNHLNQKQIRVDTVGTKHVRQPQVVSNVTVECVTDTWVDSEGLGSTDEERVKSMEKDTCPGFISDGEDRVVWTNKAYRQMAGVRGHVVDGDDMTVVLVRKDKLTPLPVTYPGFTCKVKVTSAANSQEQQTPSPLSPTLTLPCDVWRMERGACAWRLDVKAALSLGR